MKKLVKNLVKAIIKAGLILGFFYLAGLCEQFVECHPWLLIPLGGYAFYLVLRDM